MEHKPRRAIRNLLAVERGGHPMELVCAHPLLARAHEVNGIHPLVHRDMRVLEDRTHLRGERLSAILALPQAGASALALQFVGFAHYTAVRADRSIGPTFRFPERDGFLFVGEKFVLWRVFHAQSLLILFGYVKWIIPQNLESIGLTGRFSRPDALAGLAACAASAETMMERIEGCAQGQMSQGGCGNLRGLQAPPPCPE